MAVMCVWYFPIETKYRRLPGFLRYHTFETGYANHLELGIAYYYLSLIVPQRKGVILIHQASHDTTRAMISPILLAVACYPAEKTRTKIIYVGIVPSIFFLFISIVA